MGEAAMGAARLVFGVCGVVMDWTLVFVVVVCLWTVSVDCGL